MTSIREEVEQLKWVHRIDLGNGIITPGQWPRNPLISAAFSDIDFSGKKVLDIGCWDGLWAFEAERQGA
jgi:tRNA (mo5U34)-methyltransferase